MYKLFNLNISCILKLNLIGPERPYFVGLEHSLKEIKNDAEEIIEEQEFLFVKTESHFEIEQDGELMELQDKLGGQSTKSTINPSENTNNISNLKVIFDDGYGIFYPKSVGQSILHNMVGVDVRGGSSPGDVLSVISFLPFTLPLIILLAFILQLIIFIIIQFFEISSVNLNFKKKK